DGLERVAQAGADALVLCGVPDAGAHQVIHEKVRLFGSNDDVKLLGADGFFTAEALDASAANMVVLAPGVRAGHMPEAAAGFVGTLCKRLGIEKDAVEPYAVHAAEAVALLLDSVDSVGFSRTSLVQRLFDGTPRDGPL